MLRRIARARAITVLVHVLVPSSVGSGDPLKHCCVLTHLQAGSWDEPASFLQLTAAAARRTPPRLPPHRWQKRRAPVKCLLGSCASPASHSRPSTGSASATRSADPEPAAVNEYEPRLNSSAHSSTPAQPAATESVPRDIRASRSAAAAVCCGTGRAAAAAAAAPFGAIQGRLSGHPVQVVPTGERGSGLGQHLNLIDVVPEGVGEPQDEFLEAAHCPRLDRPGMREPGSRRVDPWRQLRRTPSDTVTMTLAARHCSSPALTSAGAPGPANAGYRRPNAHWKPFGEPLDEFAVCPGREDPLGAGEGVLLFGQRAQRQILGGRPVVACVVRQRRRNLGLPGQIAQPRRQFIEARPHRDAAGTPGVGDQRELPDHCRDALLDRILVDAKPSGGVQNGRSGSVRMSRRRGRWWQGLT